MLTLLRRSLVLALFFLVLLGLAYPLAETGLAGTLFPGRSGGSLTANGSTLIGQRWKGTRWFHGRPDPDNPMASGPTNLGPRSEKLRDQVEARIDRWHRLGVKPTPELVTGSGSGLDPDISPRAAYAQVPMVAKARHLPPSVVRHLVSASIRGPQLGFLGAPYVNVLELNESLARLR